VDGAKAVSLQIDRVGKLRVLCLEDSPTDAELVRETLSGATSAIEIRLASDKRGFEELLADGPYDVILADFALPGFDAHGALELAKVACPTTPFICVSGSIGEEATVELLKNGADDVVLKDRLARLPFAVRRAIDERAHAEELAESRELYESVLRTAMDGFMLVDLDTRILEVNNSYLTMSGYSQTELLTMRISDLEVLESPEEVAARAARVASAGSDRFESKHRRKDGRIFDVEASVRAEPTIGVLSVFFRDITDRKRREAYALLARTVLTILNEPAGDGDSIQRVAAALRAGTGFDAVGIRLQDGEGFPFVAEEGFPPDYLLAENTLIARDEVGEALRDESGNVILECTCGLVASSKGDPLLTAGGSFWANDSHQMLDLPRAEKQRVHACNLCNLGGFSSVALVPIRDKERIVGLIHFSDRRKNGFDAENVELLEGIALHIGEALTRKDGEERLVRSLASTIRVVSLLSESRDPYTAGHQRRVSELSVAIARKMGMSKEKVNQIRMESLLHDIGKMSIPAEILSKPGKLSPVEYELIKGHSEAGYSIVKGADLQNPIADVIFQHHERLDGSGYPRGLSADQILPGARIIMVADVVEAMSSHRPYRAALGVQAALAEIHAGAGVRYDSAVAKACGEVFREDGFVFAE